MMSQSNNVQEIELANCQVGGRSRERPRGALQLLQSGEKGEFQPGIEVSTG
jgi:hypothetical protein